MAREDITFIKKAKENIKPILLLWRQIIGETVAKVFIKYLIIMFLSHWNTEHVYSFSKLALAY